jgi:hypothetical protein
MSTCEFRKIKLTEATRRNPVGGYRVFCNCNGLPCLVDDGDSQNCLRFAWVKKVQNKTAQLVKVQNELNQLALEGMPDHG